MFFAEKKYRGADVVSQVLFTYSMLWTRKQTDEDVEEAEPALEGERYKTGNKLFENRIEG